MILLLQIILIACLLMIFYQDHKERMVFWWLFPTIGVGLAGLHIREVGMQQFMIHIGFTTGIVIVLMTVLFLYIKWRLGSFNFRAAIGIGDIWMLLALAIGFPPVSFTTLLVFGLLFALITHQLLKQLQKTNPSEVLHSFDRLDATLAQDSISRKRNTNTDLKNTVPLAGYLSLYFIGVFIVYWTGLYPNLYVI